MADLLDLFSAAVRKHPDRVAIVDGSGRETRFGDLEMRANGLAARWHDRGVGVGDRVLLAMPLTADLYASLAALWSLGATVVLPEPAMGLAGVRHAARVAGPGAFCASGWYSLLKLVLPELWRLPLLRPGPVRSAAMEDIQVSTGDVALISFTSGTTGAPKAIPRHHRVLGAQYEAVAELLESDADERDLVAFPVLTLVNLAAGRTSILPNWQTGRIGQLAPSRLAEWLGRQKVTRCLIPPVLLDKLLQADLPESLHTVFTGGGPVFPDLVARLRDEAGMSIKCIYGCTEAEPIACLDAAQIGEDDMARMAGGGGLLVGAPVHQVQVRIVDREVQVAGPHVIEHYLDPADDESNKVVEGPVTWHRTGDAGMLDDAGRIWLLGRVGDEAETTLGKLHPFSIEIAARLWPGVRQSALAMQAGRAVLAVKGDQGHLPEWSRRAARFGVERVIVVEDIPMDRRHHSKVDRAALQRLIAGRGEAHGQG